VWHTPAEKALLLRMLNLEQAADNTPTS
jgi:hypothetical protein